MAALTACALAATPAAVHAQDPTGPLGPANFNGVSRDQASGYDEVFMAGDFDGLLAPTRGSLVAAPAAGDGAVLPDGAPTVNGSVLAIADDGAGGVFVGGEFRGVGTAVRSNLAHILADGTVDPGWRPDPNGVVTSLDRIGDRLAVGGRFSVLGDRGAPGLGVLGVRSGAQTAFSTTTEGVTHFDATGDRIYVTGDLRLPTGDRPAAAALNLTSGAVLPWRPAPGANARGLSTPDAIKAVGTTVALGFGDADEERHDLVGLDAATGAVRWRDATPAAGPLLAKTGSRLYVVPNAVRSTPSGAPAHPVVPYALDPATGATVWRAGAALSAPFAPAQAFGALVRGQTLYLVGSFTRAGSTERRGAAAFDQASGTLLPWDPALGTSGVDAVPGGRVIGPLGSRLILGGELTGAGKRLATVTDLVRFGPAPTFVFDRTFAPIRSLSPIADPARPGRYLKGINALAVRGRTLYLGGAFSALNGLPRASLAALDLDTRTLTTWAPPAADVYGLLLYGEDRVLVNDRSGAPEFTRTGARVPTADTVAGRLAALQSALVLDGRTSATARFVAPTPGTVHAFLSLGEGYTVAFASATATVAGQAVEATLALNDAGRLIRSVYPGFRFASTATFDFDTKYTTGRATVTTRSSDPPGP